MHGTPTPNLSFGLPRLDRRSGAYNTGTSNIVLYEDTWFVEKAPPAVEHSAPSAFPNLPHNSAEA
jgi:hypothetical protein